MQVSLVRADTQFHLSLLNYTLLVHSSYSITSKHIRGQHKSLLNRSSQSTIDKSNHANTSGNSRNGNDDTDSDRRDSDEESLFPDGFSSSDEDGSNDSSSSSACGDDEDIVSTAHRGQYNEYNKYSEYNEYINRGSPQVLSTNNPINGMNGVYSSPSQVLSSQTVDMSRGIHPGRVSLTAKPHDYSETYEKQASKRGVHAAHGRTLGELVRLLAATQAEYQTYLRSGVSSQSSINSVSDSTTSKSSTGNAGSDNSDNSTKQCEYDRLIQAMELAIELCVFNKFNARLHANDVPADLVKRITDIYKRDTVDVQHDRPFARYDLTADPSAATAGAEVVEEEPKEGRHKASYVSLLLPEVYHTSLFINKDRFIADIRVEVENGQIYMSSAVGAIQPSTFSGSNGTLGTMLSAAVVSVRSNGNRREKEDIEVLTYAQKLLDLRQAVAGFNWPLVQRIIGLQSGDQVFDVDASGSTPSGATIGTYRGNFNQESKDEDKIRINWKNEHNHVEYPPISVAGAISKQFFPFDVHHCARASALLHCDISAEVKRLRVEIANVKAVKMLQACMIQGRLLDVYGIARSVHSTGHSGKVGSMSASTMANARLTSALSSTRNIENTDNNSNSAMANVFGMYAIADDESGEDEQEEEELNQDEDQFLQFSPDFESGLENLVQAIHLVDRHPLIGKASTSSAIAKNEKGKERNEEEEEEEAYYTRSRRLVHELRLAGTLADIRTFVKEARWEEAVQLIADDEYHHLFHQHIAFKGTSYEG